MAIKAIAQVDVAFLVSVCGPERVFPGRAPLAALVPDQAENGVPGVRVEIASTGEVARILKYAFEKGLPVTQAGGSLEAPALGVTLDLSGMNRILELDREHLALTVEPGVLLAELSSFVEAREYFYPWDPRGETATIAGQINTNAGTTKALKAGVTRDYVLGLEVVLPNGEIMELGGKDAKTSSGHALKDLIVGSGGTLGIVTRATLKLAPLPRKAVSLLFPFQDFGMAMEAVIKVIKSGTIPTAIEYMRKDVILASGQPMASGLHSQLAQVYLQLAFDGDTHREIEAAHEQVTRLCLEAGALDVLIFDSEDHRDAIWKTRATFLEAIKTSVLPHSVALGA
jgi:glycolate oxidase